jgi:dCTP deaminase
MSVLGKTRIEKLLHARKLEDRLIVTPLLDPSQIGPASIDVRLGHDFITTRRGNLPYIDPAQITVDPNRYQSRHYVNLREAFYLHPNELVLASTLEYLRLPKSVAASVTSRSSWGRAGLVIATATAVHPGFTGTITLELVNHGEVPLVLYPGLSIAQLVLSEAVGSKEYRGRFGGHTDAQHAAVGGEDRRDIDFWTPKTEPGSKRPTRSASLRPEKPD